ncbi:long-chain-alcohol O-fatty-acyltransferase-like [Coffea arabica]|uniref:Long-chain-alcohol O-fatty-acyltransferase-like n=1 Tax=Coffea arabica TaxID=13443 RepID=A0A6P6SGN1_COFAR|nr:long-chain-alcohol O-fatty-acyltransferase-like [Coffea arabica]
MGVEIQNFVKVWTAAVWSQFYTYYVVSRIPSGLLTRLVSLVPIFYLFIILPLSLSSFHLGAPTVLYLVWLANFKLLLFAFNLGPLSSHPPLSLPHFIATALLPIKDKDDPTHFRPSSSNDAQNSSIKRRPPSQITPEIMRKRRQFKIIRFTIKLVVLVTAISLYRYRAHLHPCFVTAIYCCHMYLGIEFVLALTAVPVRAILGLELARQFNEPYLATSLQDFWGRRWNLIVSTILRQIVYDPVKSIFTPKLGRNSSLAVATLATFLVSGICVTLEIYVKKAVAGRWRLHRAASGLLTVGFVGVTSAWLFFPQLIRYGVDQRVIEECHAFLSFLGNILSLPTSYWRRKL